MLLLFGLLYTLQRVTSSVTKQKKNRLDLDGASIVSYYAEDVCMYYKQ
jgi:hypothetical protein